MDDTIINITTGNKPVLWVYRNGKITYREIPWKNWIFVTGDPFDLEFLENQLSSSETINYEYAEKNDIFGAINGIKIYVEQRYEREIIRIVRSIGYGRKYRIFNGLIDSGLKIMAHNNLTYFKTESPLDYDPEIPVVKLKVSYKHGSFLKGEINRQSTESEREAQDIFTHHMGYSPIIIYENAKDVAKFINRLAESRGKNIKYHMRGGNSFMSYGRVNYSEPLIHISGKVCINSHSFMFNEGSLTGIMEISRLTGLAPETVCKVTPGTAVSSMENYEAIKSGILIITDKDDHEDEKTLQEFMENDKGGYVFQPFPGFYEDVYEIDFSSMYPSIMHHFNMSPETINKSRGFKLPGDNPYFTEPLKGFIPSSLDILLKRRLMYKYNKKVRSDFESRDKVLKWLLLTSFGYTGFKNARFGKIEMHEAITSVGRWAIEKAMAICESEGFHIIHGIVDSLFIQGNGNMVNVLSRIRREVSVNIVLDGYYKWMVFLPARSGLGALNRYYGLKYDGNYKIRGIGGRRSDTPPIVIQAHDKILDLLKTLDPGLNNDTVYYEYKKIKDYYLNHMERFDTISFSLSVRPSKYISDYKVNNIQKSAIKSFYENGIEIMPGQTMSVIVNDSSKKIVNMGAGNIDRKFYKKIILRNFEPFDFLFSCIKNSQQHDLLWWS
jgi:DNA polymerase I